MNKIVHEHLKASELPEKLRGGIDASATVTVTVQEEQFPPRPRPTSADLRRMLEEAHKSAVPRITLDEAVDRVRRLRDEWED